MTSTESSFRSGASRACLVGAVCAVLHSGASFLVSRVHWGVILLTLPPLLAGIFAAGLLLRQRHWLWAALAVITALIFGRAAGHYTNLFGPFQWIASACGALFLLLLAHATRYLTTSPRVV